MSSSLRARLGEAERQFDCCDTTFTVRAAGPAATRAVDRAVATAEGLEARLNAFDDASDVATLNRTGAVESRHVAALVRRGIAYAERTDGAFDVRHGATEQALKAYIRGDGTDLPTLDAPADVTVDGDRVETDAPLDLNGLAKGYIVDRTRDALAGAGRRVFVDGGGDMTPPDGAVAIESPYGDPSPLAVLDTDRYVATSGSYRRRRGTVDHRYDPRTGRLGGRYDSVTVLAARDCTEADALATALSATPLDDALDLVAAWDGVAALLVRDGVFHRAGGFDAHVA